MAAVEMSVAPELSGFLSRIRPGEPIDLGELSLVPLFADAEPVEAELLEEGLRSGHTTVTEVSAGGSVNEVRVEHSGVFPLLLIDGEQVVGARRGRASSRA
jgi:hypothetical protein